jgi:hypothetical protein
MAWVITRRTALALLAALVLALGAAAGAGAAIVTSHDAQGRPITFDVRVTAADTDWYASVLSAAVHGSEISGVTIRIVPEPSISGMCGSLEAAACYTGRQGAPIIIVPAGKSALLESILLHEYGHHLDTFWHVPAVRELNGTPAWWAARGMAGLLSRGQVAFDYSLGWSHSTGEIFAEDYAFIHTGTRYGIPWLSPPDEALKTTLFAELGTPPAALPAAPEVPLVINRRGTLVPRDRFSVPFGLLGPGRHVTLTASVAQSKRKGIRARAQVVCDGKVLASGTFGRGRSRRTLDLPSLGPATCDARLISNAGVRLAYTLRLRLAVETA